MTVLDVTLSANSYSFLVTASIMSVFFTLMCIFTLMRLFSHYCVFFTLIMHPRPPGEAYRDQQLTTNFEL